MPFSIYFGVMLACMYHVMGRIHLARRLLPGVQDITIRVDIVEHPIHRLVLA